MHLAMQGSLKRFPFAVSGTFMFRTTFHQRVKRENCKCWHYNIQSHVGVQDCRGAFKLCYKCFPYAQLASPPNSAVLTPNWKTNKIL